MCFGVLSGSLPDDVHADHFKRRLRELDTQNEQTYLDNYSTGDNEVLMILRFSTKSAILHDPPYLEQKQLEVKL